MERGIKIMLKFLNKFKKKTTEELLKEKEKYYHKNIMPQIKEIISNEDVVKM